MGIVLASHSMSLDGFIVQADRTPGQLHEWLWSGDQPSRHGGAMKLSEESREWFDAAVDRVGATIAGRRTYEDSERWGGKLPFEWPFFIVTHDPPSVADELPFIFVTEGVERAVELAKEAAGDKNVTVMGGDLTASAWPRGSSTRSTSTLLPVVLGEGVRLFDESNGSGELELQRVVDAPGVTHLSYRVV